MGDAVSTFAKRAASVSPRSRFCGRGGGIEGASYFIDEPRTKEPAARRPFHDGRHDLLFSHLHRRLDRKAEIRPCHRCGWRQPLTVIRRPAVDLEGTAVSNAQSV